VSRVGHTHRLDTARHHRQRAPGVGQDEADVGAARHGPGVHQINGGTGGVEGPFGDRGHRDGAVGRVGGVDEDDGLSPVQFIKDRCEALVTEVGAVGVGHHAHPVQREVVETVGDLSEGGCDIGHRQGGEVPEPSGVVTRHLGGGMVQVAGYLDTPERRRAANNPNGDILTLIAVRYVWKGTSMTADELDQLLLDRFNLGRHDLIAALKTLPAHRPWAATLTAEEARLLNDAGFVEDPAAYTEIAADVIAHMARLYSTSYTAADVASGLGVNDSRVRQRRLARTLWAIDDGGTWVYPAVQFEVVDAGRGQPQKVKQVRGLDLVLPDLLTKDLHPTAVAGFLLTPQPELRIAGHPMSVKEWLRHGESVEPVLALIEVGEWAVT
jgi:hypothetical protein